MNVASPRSHVLIGLGLIAHLCLFHIRAAEVEADASAGHRARQTSDLFPDIASSASGVWIAAWQTTDEFADDSGAGIGADPDIVFVRSADGGANWSRPRALSTTAATDSGGDFTPGLATDSDGNWVCVWISTDSLGGRIGPDTDVVVSRSQDDGQTWSDPEPVAKSAEIDDARGADLSPSIAFGDGMFLIAYEVFGGFGPDADIVVVRSADAGLSWGDPISIKSTPGEDWAADFSPRLATDGRGNWLCAWWSDNLVAEPYPSSPSRPFTILCSFSADDGATWSPPEAISAGLDSGPDYRFASVDYAGDQWNVVWESVRHAGAADLSGDSAPSSAQESELGISFSSSTGSAGEWTRPERLAAGEPASDATSDSGSALNSSRARVLRFPVIATSPEGRSVVAWESTSGDSESRIEGLALSDGVTGGAADGLRDSDRGRIVDITAALGTNARGTRFMNPSIEADAETWLVIWESFAPVESAGATGAEIRHVYAARSSDGARTWTAPFRLD